MTQEFCKSEDFLSALERQARRDQDGFTPAWVFRGQSDASWPLLPSSCRAPGLRSLVDRELHLMEKTKIEYLSEPASDWYCLVLAERAVLRRFAEMCDALNIRLPATSDVTSEMSHPVSALAAVAQHHGVGTPLLDWTYDFRAAALFASESGDERDGCVWAFNTRWLEPSLDHSVPATTRACVLRVPRSDSAFIAAQRGLFTYADLDGDFFREHRRHPRFDEQVDGGALVEFPLPARLKVEVREHLFALGVSRAHLMPTLDNARNAVEDRYKALEPGSD